MLVIWTGKPASIEVVVPAVHRRGGASGPTGASTGPRALFPASDVLELTAGTHA
jgi:hypothetical protein